MKKNNKIIAIAIIIIVATLAIFITFEPTGRAIDSPTELIESCFIGFEISEEKIGENIQFSLIDQENLFGNYGGLANYHDEEFESSEDYLLRAYDAENNLLGSFTLSSSRFVFYDNFEEQEGEDLGGIIETESGIIFVTIPYTENIDSIKVENNGVETKLNINPSEIICERTCKIEEETGDAETQDCCIGFIQSSQEPDLRGDTNNDGVVNELDITDLTSQFGLSRKGLSADLNNDGRVDLADFVILRASLNSPKEPFICTNCGDGICSNEEDSYVCPEDCIQEFTCPENMIKLGASCSTAKERFEDWKTDRISTNTIMKDTEEYILPSLS